MNKFWDTGEEVKEKNNRCIDYKIESFGDLLKAFKSISKQPHLFKAKNDKDVGDFFEKLLGKTVDNKEFPDLEEIETEIKTSGGKKKTTGFTKSPEGGMAIRELVDKFGYASDLGEINKNGDTMKRLMISLNYKPNNRGFYLKVDDNKLYIMKDGEKLSWWNISTLVESIVGKMPNLAFINYTKTTETVSFNNLILYQDINPENIIELIQNSEMIVDIRARHGRTGESYVRDRGTAFRLKNHNVYSKLFERQTRS